MNKFADSLKVLVQFHSAKGGTVDTVMSSSLEFPAGTNPSGAKNLQDPFGQIHAKSRVINFSSKPNSFAGCPFTESTLNVSPIHFPFLGSTLDDETKSFTRILFNHWLNLLCKGLEGLVI